MTTLNLKRAYEAESASDGYRVYIDKLWPQGLSHETFHYDAWDKDIAPSNDLRHWFHDNRDANWEEFEEKYRAELKANPDFTQFVDELEGHKVVTLLYSSKNQEENNAVVVYDTLLKEYPNRFN